MPLGFKARSDNLALPHGGKSTGGWIGRKPLRECKYKFNHNISWSYYSKILGNPIMIEMSLFGPYLAPVDKGAGIYRSDYCSF